MQRKGKKNTRHGEDILNFCQNNEVQKQHPLEIWFSPRVLITKRKTGAI